MTENFYPWPNRTLCGVLEDMRKCHKTYNFGVLASLIEEAQIYGDRMEAGLSDKRDIREWEVIRTKLKHEIKDLIKQRDELTKT